MIFCGMVHKTPFPMAHYTLIGVAPFFDSTVPVTHPKMNRVVRWFAARGMDVEDVPYDGNCACHSVGPLAAEWLGRPTTVREVREMFVHVCRTDPRLREEVEHEVVQEIATGKWDDDTTASDVLDHFAQDSVYLPPFLLAKAFSLAFGRRIRLWFVGTGQEGENDPVAFYDDPLKREPQYEILYIESLRHICIVRQHEQVEL